ncbi:ORF1029 [White spot syndrome virus]|uniref:Wsv276 n=3 Tax=White spot syndrome virus TaxID=342409 RepID=Q8VAV2_WSSVS|nr:wsv276 [Shrimp white spot syndrome virus]AFX59650.1 wsv276 [White spot syndrome virus]AAL33279.1 wsv276 [Shrimp white spot syndrome virus]AAL89199.1 WSSV331 [Shrimp white spot syndrome virus]ATU83818.1 ORF1029 [White spot syndrome virus]AWQ60853.1 wsv276 [Shrimp white spot syndrome virus]
MSLIDAAPITATPMAFASWECTTLVGLFVTCSTSALSALFLYKSCVFLSLLNFFKYRFDTSFIVYFARGVGSQSLPFFSNM